MVWVVEGVEIHLASAPVAAIPNANTLEWPKPLIRLRRRMR